MAAKIPWAGVVVGVQPRIRLTRSFDQSQHTYLGYVVFIAGLLGDATRSFSVGIGKAAHTKLALRVGDRIEGKGEPPADPRLEIAGLHKVSALKVVARADPATETAPPFTLLAPALEVYRARGHRRLSARTYAAACLACAWGCEMPVEMIIDQWNPHLRRYRRETFCYGPKSCSKYKAGPTRKVPGRKGMSWEEEDWVDEDATAHRGPDE